MAEGRIATRLVESSLLMVQLNNDNATAGSDEVPRSHSAFWQPPQRLSADRNGQLMRSIKADKRLTLQRGGEIVIDTGTDNGATCFFDAVIGATEIAGAKVPSIYNLPDGSTVQSRLAIQIDACNGSCRITASDGSIHRITRRANGVQTVTHEYRKFHSFGNAEPIIVLEITESTIRTDGRIETVRRMEAGGITIDRQSVPMAKPNG